MKITIVLSYGVFQEDNNQYKAYLNQALHLAQNSDLILTTGGKTNPQLPDLSEAQSVADYFISQNPTLKTKITLEDTSLTTPQNLEFCAKKIQEKGMTVDHLTVIGDSIRAPKVFSQALQYFNKLLNFNLSEEQQLETFATTVLTNDQLDLTQKITFSYKNLTIEGVRIGRNITELSHQVSSTLFENYFQKYPQLQQKAIEYRLKKWGFRK